MVPNQLIFQTIAPIATQLAQRGMAVSSEKVKDLIGNVLQANPMLSGQVDVDQLAERIQHSPSAVGMPAYNEETLARFLEIPSSDLPSMDIERIDIEQIHNHVRLEGEFREWFSDWGYETHNGQALMGLRGVEYVPDVYGNLNTLHGEFEICVSLVCDNPPSEDRVLSLLSRIEAYAEARTSFSYGDIFMVVTPNTFTTGALNALSLQNEQEKYIVAPLDGGDIHQLERANDKIPRMNVLLDVVTRAEEESRQGKLRYGPNSGPGH